MKVKVNQEQIDKLKSLIDRHGIDSLGVEPYKLIEMGFIQRYDGDLILENKPIKSLGNLAYVRDSLFLAGTPIKSLGYLKYVGDYLDLINTDIKTLGNLAYVGGHLFIKGNPLAELSDEEIRSQIEIKGKIYR